MRLIPDALLMTYWVTEISLNYLLVQNVYFWMLHGSYEGRKMPTLVLVTLDYSWLLGHWGRWGPYCRAEKTSCCSPSHPCEWFDCPWNHHQYTSNKCCFGLPEHIKVCQSAYFTYLYAVYSTALYKQHNSLLSIPLSCSPYIYFIVFLYVLKSIYICYLYVNLSP